MRAPRRTPPQPGSHAPAPRRAPAQVDETLFKSSRSSRGGGAGSTAVLSTKEMASVASLLGPVENTSLLSVADYKRVTGRDVVELEEMRQAEAAARYEELARAEARKVRMAEIEAEAKQHVAPTEIEAEHMAEAAAILSNAEMKLAEELDDVKKMNQMMAYAKVVTIRDAQINEKKVMEKERMQEERRLDEIMEIERLKAVKMYDEREQKRMRDAVEGRQVITEQIREREAERVRQLERQDQASAAAAPPRPPRRTHPLPPHPPPLLSTLPLPLAGARGDAAAARGDARRGGRRGARQDRRGRQALGGGGALERGADRTEDAGEARRAGGERADRGVQPREGPARAGVQPRAGGDQAGEGARDRAVRIRDAPRTPRASHARNSPTAHTSHPAPPPPSATGCARSRSG